MPIVCYVQAGLVDAENDLVVEEVKPSPPQLDNSLTSILCFSFDMALVMIYAQVSRCFCKVV
jgi:hypothetical protein